MNKQWDIKDMGTKQPQDFRPFSFLCTSHKYHYGISWLAKALDEASRRPHSLMLLLSDHILSWYDDFLNNNHKLFSLATSYNPKEEASDSRVEVNNVSSNQSPKIKEQSNGRFGMLGLSWVCSISSSEIQALPQEGRKKKSY